MLILGQIDRCCGVWAELFHTIQDPAMVVTPEGVILEANPATLKAAGKTRSEVIGQGICNIIHGGRWPHIKCPLEEFLKTCTSKTEETRLPGLSGDYLLNISPAREADGQVHKIVLLARELTSEELSRVDSIRTAQMAALGELAAGVAHEVNNPINGIINYAQLLLDDSSPDSHESTLLSRIVQEGERIASITHSLLSFARQDDENCDEVDIRELIEACLTLTRHQFEKDGITLTTDFPPQPLLVTGNFRQLQQVILNLLNNSRYALNARCPQPTAGKDITFHCRQTCIQNQNQVEITILDYGTGIPQGILDKLFDPFFTTKPSGEGTGLGLSISYGIIKSHGGTIEIDSTLNKYTAITITLPLLNQAPGSQQ
ncbi:MAG: PAS domain-containing protein [Desulfobulbaceae bacterium]|uniref:histidine kinase n=1 Tax=Candidatus Desulfatifera sulfidica TaxID=2841691 RepID=A0A8J6N8A6_9BACT|nr:PAS domain-containing protein [Candidatus Desulfatifera sulfidica]